MNKPVNGVGHLIVTLVILIGGGALLLSLSDRQEIVVAVTGLWGLVAGWWFRGTGNGKPK